MNNSGRDGALRRPRRVAAQIGIVSCDPFRHLTLRSAAGTSQRDVPTF
jgi:hypothetical protein